MILSKTNREFLIRIIYLSIVFGILTYLYPRGREIFEALFSVLYCFLSIFTSICIFKSIKEYKLWFIGIIILSIILILIFPNYDNTICGFAAMMLIPIGIFGMNNI